MSKGKLIWIGYGWLGVFLVWGCKHGELLDVADDYNGSSDALYCGDMKQDIASECRFFVDRRQMSTADGRSWETAFRRIQVGINHAYCAIQSNQKIDACEVWVAGLRRDDPGGYIDEDDGSTPMPTLRMREGVAVYGGFAGTEHSVEERPFFGAMDTGQLTIAAVELLTPLDYPKRIIEQIIIGANRGHLDGFLIAGGTQYNPNWDERVGGSALLLSGGTFSVAHCAIRGNGGTGNVTGGAILAVGTTLTIENSIFSNNEANVGGAIAIDGGTLAIRNSVLFDNRAESGGAISVLSPSTLQISASTLFRNTANQLGGAIEILPGDIEQNTPYITRLENNFFFFNVAKWGSSISSDLGSESTIQTQILNSTFYRNSELWTGATVEFPGAAVSNCLFWDNTHADVNLYGVGSITYSLLQPGSEMAEGEGNIVADPLLLLSVENEAVRYRLDALSPCIDAADGNRAPAADMWGNPRLDMAEVENSGQGTPAFADIGAVEFTPH